MAADLTSLELLDKRLEASRLRAELSIDKIGRSIAEALWEIALQLAKMNERKEK